MSLLLPPVRLQSVEGMAEIRCKSNANAVIVTGGDY